MIRHMMRPLPQRSQTTHRVRPNADPPVFLCNNNRRHDAHPSASFTPFSSPFPFDPSLPVMLSSPFYVLYRIKDCFVSQLPYSDLGNYEFNETPPPGYRRPSARSLCSDGDIDTPGTGHLDGSLRWKPLRKRQLHGVRHSPLSQPSKRQLHTDSRRSPKHFRPVGHSLLQNHFQQQSRIQLASVLASDRLGFRS